MLAPVALIGYTGLHGSVDLRIPSSSGLPSAYAVRARANEDRLMKTDEQIEQDVSRELRSCADIDATDIAVKVRDGVVTLTGYARN